MPKRTLHTPGLPPATRRLASLLLAAAGALSLALSAGPASAQEKAARPCDSPECRQFDFWAGDWEVRTPDGRLAGTNRIDKVLDGCVLQESWTGARGMRGMSFNIYSAADHKWHQTWVDSNGMLLVLTGEFRDGKMILRGDVQRAGKSVTNRITWEALPDGSVRQHWETSEDAGKTWSDAFVGIYVRKATDNARK